LIKEPKHHFINEYKHLKAVVKHVENIAKTILTSSIIRYLNYDRYKKRNMAICCLIQNYLSNVPIDEDFFLPFINISKDGNICTLSQKEKICSR
jgi:hypothetical protein